VLLLFRSSDGAGKGRAAVVVVPGRRPWRQAQRPRITGEPTLVTLERRRYTTMTEIATLPPGGRFASGKPKG
jgi:hypothetical protein